MDYSDDVFKTFLDKDSIPYVHTFSMEGQKTLRLNLKYLKLCVLWARDDMRESH